jgi:hypothetical protein
MGINKICSKCRIEKSIEKFYPDKTNKDGLQFNCKSCVKEYNQNHKKERKINNKKWYLVHREKIIEISKGWYKNHKKQAKEHQKEYRINHKVYKAKYVKNRRKNDINFRLKECLRSRLNYAIKGNIKSTTTIRLIGCSVKFLRKYLESQFRPGMSWKNYGYRGWHIDHIRPCASFDLSNPIEQKKCFNYKNLQPLWAEDNLIKGGKISCQ